MFPRDGHPGCGWAPSPGVLSIPRCAQHPPQVCSAPSPGVLSIPNVLSNPRCATSSTLEELLSPTSALGPFARGSPSSHPSASKLHFSKGCRLCSGAPRFLSTFIFHLKRAARQIAGKIGNERHGSESREKRATISPYLQNGEKSPV